MKCPSCKDVTLLMTEKKWVEIDYCPECRGIWLDKWELEKLIEKENQMMDNYQHHDDSARHYDESDKWHYHKKKKKSSIFGEISDIFDF